jgi:hypothetical protein
MSKGDESAASDFGEEHVFRASKRSIALISEEGDEVRRPGGGDDGQSAGVCIIVTELSHGEDERGGRVDASVRPATASPSTPALSNGGEEGHCTGVCTTVMAFTGRSWSHGVADERALSSYSGAVVSLVRGDGGSSPPLIGRIEPVAELIEDSHVDENERDGVARSATLVILAGGSDPSPSPSSLGQGDDDTCASSSATVVKSDHCAASHSGDERVGVDGSEVDILMLTRQVGGQRTRLDRSAREFYTQGRGNAAPQ